jgi:hypothetical protein
MYNQKGRKVGGNHISPHKTFESVAKAKGDLMGLLK